MNFYQTPNDTVRPSEVRRLRQAFMEALDEIENRELADYILRELVEPLAVVLVKERGMGEETAINQASDFWAAVIDDDKIFRILFPIELPAPRGQEEVTDA